MVCKIKEVEAHIESSKGTAEDIIKAVNQGDIQRLISMEKHGQDLIAFLNETDSSNTLLHYAVKANNKDITELMLMRGALVNAQNAFGEIPLHYCAGQYKNVELAKLLFFKGSNPYMKNTLGDSPLGNYISLFHLFRSC